MFECSNVLYITCINNIWPTVHEVINGCTVFCLFVIYYVLICSTNVVMNYSEVETKVREATNDETWGPPGTLMGEISKYTFTYEHHPEVMAMLWKRMFESKRNWRRTYKVLFMCVQCT